MGILEEAIERYRKTKTATKSTVTVNGTPVTKIFALAKSAKKKIAQAKAATKEIRRKAKRKPNARAGRPKRATRSVWNSTAIRGHKVSGGLPSLGKRR